MLVIIGDINIISTLPKVIDHMYIHVFTIIIIKQVIFRKECTLSIWYLVFTNHFM